MSNSKYSSQPIFSEDAKAIRNYCKQNGQSVVDFFSAVVKLLNSNPLLFSANPNIPIYDSVTLSEEIKKKVVKDNNRILGFYLRTERMMKSMYRDMSFHFEVDSVIKEKNHPFWEEYDYQNYIHRKIYSEKFGVKTDEEVFAIVKEICGVEEEADYKLSRMRTTSKRISVNKGTV